MYLSVSFNIHSCTSMFLMILTLQGCLEEIDESIPMQDIDESIPTQEMDESIPMLFIGDW